MLKKYWAETFRNFGVGLMVASVVLFISERIAPSTSVVTFLAGLTAILIGSILLRGGKNDK
ncbi:hypothetical protein [Hydrogenivirga sp. 128-5-R1-1]|uniref:hypothetical protein n=1 Tax=Hydrogenivirga sp. 128-5-R1-1 TaxID=392423 RepID=UPI000515AE12|nr:hypothetical protein [Hydrogenivirga sp. 128-5-R1-1]